MTSKPVAVAVLGRGLVDPTAPTVRVDDEAVTRGRAAFETLRVYGGRPFRLAEHLERLARSAEALGIQTPDLGALTELARLAVESAEADDVVLRLYWTPGPPGGSPEGFAIVAEIPTWIEESRARGQRVVSLEFPRRTIDWLLPGVKSTSYATHIAAESEAHRRGVDDAILVDSDGIVLEGPVTNVWWREGPTTLVTPGDELGILAGETRAALLELAAGEGFTVETGAFALTRLLDADEVFTSSSVREVMPVVEVDGASFAIGRAAVALQAALRAMAVS